MGQDMLRKGLAVAVILLFIGVAFTIPINANVSRPNLDPVTDREMLEEDNTTPIELVFQLITKLHNNKELLELLTDNDAEVDIQKEISSIVERDEDLNSIVDQLSTNDWGFDDDSSALEWPFPVICFLLFPLAVFGFSLIIWGIGFFILPIIDYIGSIFNCFWC